MLVIHKMATGFEQTGLGMFLWSLLYLVACCSGEGAEGKESCRPGGSALTRPSAGLKEMASAELQCSCVSLYKINGIFLRKQSPA